MGERKKQIIQGYNEIYNKFLNKSKERSKLFTYDKAVDSYLSILQ